MVFQTIIISLAALGLQCCEGYSLVVACGLFIAVAPLVFEHGLYGTRAQ